MAIQVYVRKLEHGKEDGLTNRSHKHFFNNAENFSKVLYN